MPKAVVRQAELFARAKRLMAQGFKQADAARKVGRSRDWLKELLGRERRGEFQSPRRPQSSR